MTFLRWLRHSFVSRWAARRVFSKDFLADIEAAIAACEHRHGGEIRFVIESALHPRAVMRGLTPRERAMQVFAHARVWDTAANNGVLIYVLYADRDVEIVTDRGFNGKVTPAQWEAVCGVMEQAFKAGDYRAGCLRGIEAASEVIARHFPISDRNELADAPSLI